MKTKTLFSMILLIFSTIFTAFTSQAQDTYQALNLQAHDNRQQTSKVDHENLLNGILPQATKDNPYGGDDNVSTILELDQEVGRAYRTGVIGAADLVNKDGYSFYSENGAPASITWDNFDTDNIHSFLSDHIIEVDVDFGTEKSAMISGSIWNGKVFKGFGWEKTTIKGVHGVLAFDFRKETGNPKAVFPFALRKCNNILAKAQIFSIFKGDAKISTGDVSAMGNQGSDFFSKEEKKNLVDQARKGNGINQFESTDGKMIININMSPIAISEGSSVDNSSTGGGSTERVIEKRIESTTMTQPSDGSQSFSWKSSEPIQLIPDQVLYAQGPTAPQGSLACGTCPSPSGYSLTREDVAYSQQHMAAQTDLARRDLRQQKAQTAGIWLGTIFQGANLGLDIYNTVRGPGYRNPIPPIYNPGGPNSGPGNN